MKEYDLIIVGGGASGLAAALSAANKYKEIRILIIEQLARVGKKILVTGNGRCNLTNLNAENHSYRNSEFASNALNKYNPGKVIGFFNSLGLETYTDTAGRVYPRSNSATSVLDCLRYAVMSRNVEIITEEKINKIIREDKAFILNDSYKAGKVIIACGGKASPAQGSDGSGYVLAEKTGHRITSLVPSLVPLNSKPDLVKQVKGLRAADVRLLAEGEYNDAVSSGEILFTENGISGIAAMELASFCERELRKGNEPLLHIDFLPEFDFESLKKKISGLIEIKRGQPMDTFLTGFFPKQIGIMILKNAELYSPGLNIDIMSEGMIENAVQSIKDFTLPVTGTKGFQNAQVTSGGVDVRDIDSETMMSVVCKNLYFCGEITDVDGGCGGYNLQWAFASGLLAGELNDKN